MSKLWALIKIQLQGAYVQKSKKKTGIAVLILFVLMTLLMGTVYGLIIYETLERVGLASGSVFIMMIVGFVMSALVATANVKTLLFDNKKQELLMKLPLSQGTIVLSKMVTLFIENAAMIILLSLPVSIRCLLEGYFSATDFLLVLLCMIALSMLSSAISSVLGFIISYFTSRYKAARVIMTMLYIALSLGGTFLYIFIINEGFFEYLSASSDGLLSTFGSWPLFSLIYQVIIEGSFLSLILLTLLSVGLMSLIMLLYHRAYKGMYSLFQTREKGKRIAHDSQVRKPEVALAMKDLTKLIKTPFLLMNTTIFLLFFLAFICYMLINRSFLDNLLLQTKQLNFSLIALAIALGISVSSQLSGVSISIEMDKFWILKTLPIEPKRILLAKVIPQFLITLLVLVAYTLFGIFVIKTISLYQWLLIFLSSAVFSWAHSAMGLIINLFFPKIDAASEQDVIKRSTSTIMCLIYALVFFLLLGLLIPLYLMLPMDLLIAVVLLVSVLYAGLTYLILIRKGTKLFKALS